MLYISSYIIAKGDVFRLRRVKGKSDGYWLLVIGYTKNGKKATAN